MSENRTERIRELFNSALKCGRQKREVFLSEACAGDQSLKEEVVSLLDAFETVPDFLDKPEQPDPVRSGPENPYGATWPGTEPCLPFERLGEFRLIKRLGEGGMGVVYIAIQEPLNREVALKVIRPEWIGSIEAETRFRREIDAVARLRHPNIVTLFRSGEENGIHYFAMEFVPGRGLDAVLDEVSSGEEKVPLPRILGWSLEIARALDSAHRAGIIHRDVKPSNIRITPEGSAKLMDFSVARQSMLSTMTLTGDFRGTPHYASPEQIKARRREIDARTDIYSLGVTLYEAVTGRVPFQGKTTEQVFLKILDEEPVPPRRLNRLVSRGLETVIAKAMEKDPKRRYQTMAGFAEDLERLIAGQPVKARPAGWARRSIKWIDRHKFASLAGAAVFFMAAAAAILVLVLSVQRQEQLDSAMRRFVPVKKALEWPGVGSYARPWGWCQRIAPHYPGPYLLEATVDIGEGALADAAGNLGRCIERCVGLKEKSLENDAHYLLGLVTLELSEECVGDPRKKGILLEKADFELRRAGPFDPLSEEALVLREPDLSSISTGRARFGLKTLKLNRDHFLVQLYLGISIFDNLYKGGKKREFEKAIEHFKNTLDARPDNVIALTFLGRTYYFFARYYNFLGLLERAEEYQLRALAAAGDEPHQMIYSTLGQVRLLRGDNDKALEYFNKALEAGGDDDHIQNAFGGIGKVYVRKGETEKALEHYAEALKRQRDIHVKMAMAELHLLRGEVDRASEDLTWALDLVSNTPSRGVASVYLMSARIHLEQNKYLEAVRQLGCLDIKPIPPSPRDLSLACLLIATFPDEIQRNHWTGLATNLAEKAGYNARFEDKDSPLSHSARGAAAYLRGEYGVAVENFRKALSAREKWPSDVREYHWSEDARDMFWRWRISSSLARLLTGKPMRRRLGSSSLGLKRNT